MQRAERKNPRLKARAEALGRELSRMEEEIKSMSRAANHPDRDAAMRRLRRFTEEQELTREIQASRGAVRPDNSGRDMSAAPPFERGSQEGEERGSLTPGMAPKGPPDMRFAKYFVTGSLQSIRPLRQERRVQRKKAIIMMIVAIVLLYGVFSLIFWR